MVISTLFLSDSCEIVRLVAFIIYAPVGDAGSSVAKKLSTYLDNVLFRNAEE